MPAKRKPFVCPACGHKGAYHRKADDKMRCTTCGYVGLKKEFTGK